MATVLKMLYLLDQYLFTLFESLDWAEVDHRNNTIDYENITMIGEFTGGTDVAHHS